MDRAARRALGEKARALASVAQLMQTLDHRSVLQRGFALVWHAEGGLAPRAAALAAGEAVALEFADGRRSALIDGGPAPAGPDSPDQAPVKISAVTPEPQKPAIKRGGKRGPDESGQSSLF
jgi:exodeoxyribonuclease VII large subunit